MENMHTDVRVNWWLKRGRCSLNLMRKLLLSLIQKITPPQLSTWPKVYFLLNQSALSSARLRFTEENFSAQAEDSSLRNQSAAPSLIIVKLRSWPKFLRLLERHIYPRHFVLSCIKMRLTEAELSAQPKCISPPYYKTASHCVTEG